MKKITKCDKHIPLTPKGRKAVELILNEVLPKIPQDKFYMDVGFYGDSTKLKMFIKSYPYNTMEKLNECGTICCLWGWTLTHPKVRKALSLKVNSPNFIRDSIRTDKFFGKKTDKFVADAFFSAGYCNSLVKAKSRLRYVLQHGFPVNKYRIGRFSGYDIIWKGIFYREGML